GQPEYVVNFMTFIAEELREIMAELGFRTVREMVGRVDRLDVRDVSGHWKAKGVDLTQLLYAPHVASTVARHCIQAQDHGLAKGLSGGRVVVYPPRTATFAPEENIIVGNVSLYGATGGEVFLRGLAGERFCVRNSGVVAVVEGVGDHGCEYMTKGLVVVLGKTGRNFAAGMSGGVAYVLDEDGTFAGHVNKGMVELDPLDEKDLATVRGLIQRHYDYTHSAVAWRLLSGWKETAKHLVKVIPVE